MSFFQGIREMSVTFWPPPPSRPVWQKPVFLRTRQKISFFLWFFDMYITWFRMVWTFDFEGTKKWREILPNTYFYVSEHSASFSSVIRKEPIYMRAGSYSALFKILYFPFFSTIAQNDGLFLHLCQHLMGFWHSCLKRNSHNC